MNFFFSFFLVWFLLKTVLNLQITWKVKQVPVYFSLHSYYTDSKVLSFLSAKLSRPDAIFT